MSDDRFDTLYDAALEAGVAVDELTDFSRAQPHCDECGSYNLDEVTQKRGEEYHAPVVTLYWLCECGNKIRNERKEDCEGKVYIGPGDDSYWK